MIYTMTWNPSLDYVAEVKNFETGKVNRTIQEEIFPGGKGINVSIVLKNLGVESTAWGFTAGFTGLEIERLLKERNLRTDFIRLKDGTSRINIKLRMEPATEINGQGPVIGEREIHEFYKKAEILKADDILVLAGSVPGSIPESIYGDIMYFLRERKVRFVVDASGELLRKALSYGPFLIKPNHQELGEFFGRQIAGREEAAEYAKKMKRMGARNVLVSMGEKGAVLAAEDGQIYQADAPCGKVIHAVGAGDSMVAGFLAGYMKNASFEEALRWGVCAGSASAFSHDLTTGEKFRELYQSYAPK